MEEIAAFPPSIFEYILGLTKSSYIGANSEKDFTAEAHDSVFTPVLKRT
jgi:hypothetical protein